MKKPLVFVLLFLLASTGPRALGQPKPTVHGYVRNAANGEGLIGASVQIKGWSTGVVTNAYGYFSLTLASPSDTLQIQSLGFRTQEIPFATVAVTPSVEIRLQADQQTLAEVTVNARQPAQSIRNLEMSTATLDMKTLKALPTLLGEVDVVRGLLLVPGVTSVGEGATGFNVRGGGVDQNLILLDEAPVYNYSHLMGVWIPDRITAANAK